MPVWAHASVDADQQMELGPRGNRRVWGWKLRRAEHADQQGREGKGIVMPKIVDRTGQRFGKLLVLRDAGRKFGGVLWECRCDCGRIVCVRASALVCGDTRSCKTFGECYLRWQGGTRNEGTLAWIKRVMNSGKMHAREHGHSPPIGKPEDVLAMYHAADGQCPVCLDFPKSRLVLDHDHTTGVVRGFICGACNSAIGMARDSSDTLRRMADYLDHCKAKDGRVRAS